MKSLGQTRWILGMCAVLGGCGGGTAPAPEHATAPRAEDRREATSIAPEKDAKVPAGAASGEASKAPASSSEGADSLTGAPSPAASAFPDIAESPGAPEVEPGAALVRKEQWVAAKVRLSSLFPVFDTSGPVDAVLAGHVLYGRSCAMSNDAPCAEREHRKAIAIWEAPGTAAALAAQGGDKAEGRERLARALSAVGEALYYIAEKQRNELNRVRMPAYKGPSTREDVTRFIQTDVADWVKKKTALVEETEKAYAKIFDLKPAPPPRWAVAAASHSAFSWGKFMAEFRATPIPPAWTRQGTIAGSRLSIEELRHFYYESLDRAAEPLKARARGVYEKCRATADRTQHHDENARSCVVWLDKIADVAQAEPSVSPPRPPH